MAVQLQRMQLEEQKLSRTLLGHNLFFREKQACPQSYTGLTVADRDEAFVKAAMVERSTLVVAVAVRGKLGTAEPFVIAPASAVGLLVTDAAESDPTVCALVRSGVEVVCVPAE